ncbi:hypothetical protein B0A55_06200 [Friedmanniomyces simplex]|uniref:Glycosyltransferase family 8 protein n=1 Tax=Friedmanniomyces simplex TaxID=329884 RepID=A0A4U0XE44_9PEZI|nr:hypothetical protein B0A55_06200 [Friedmanniomyces simplex]
MAASEKKYAYTTLITRVSYLAGVIILAHTLKKQGSKYPLLVFYTPSLQDAGVKALELEARKLNLILKPCEMLEPRPDIKITLIAERFTDTWTKLRVFSVFDYDAVCYLDADMAIFKNMDSVFSRAADLPSDWIAANHACVCNTDKDDWAPSEWNIDNCAYTPLSHPDALSHPTQVNPDSRPTYHLLNSGMFLYHPSKQLWDAMLHFFDTTDKLSTYNFPDQDFLADFFRHRWVSLGWQYNALKTMRYIHPKMWRDDEVVCLHYIVDKPWVARVSADGIAGFKGKDGVTHGWWWNNYADWVAQRESEGAVEILKLMEQHSAKVDGSEEDDADMRAIGSRVQAFPSNKAGKENAAPAAANAEEAKDGGDEEEASSPFRKKVLGERGHGPVVHSQRGGETPP